MINERIAKIQNLMKQNNLDMYCILTGDYHQSEYISDYFKERVFMSGFTGSAGSMVITSNNAYLWTDGRYFIQAENQLKNTNIQLMKMGQENVPTITDFIINNRNGKVGMDGKLVSINFALELLKNNIEIEPINLVDEIWIDRPQLPKDMAYELDVKYAGVTRSEKIKQLLKVLNGKTHIISALDEICWLLNFRGNDVLNTPVVLSYMLINEDEVCLFVDQNKLTKEFKQTLLNESIKIFDYDYFYEYVKTLNNKIILMDYLKNNYGCYININKSNEIINDASPIDLMKACKNSVEQANIKNAHIKDGVAMVKFIYWLKKYIGTEIITEYSATEYLNSQRFANGAIDLSFNPIVGYNANAAMMHYSATKDNFATLNNEGVLLVDSGGQYLEGTTDITRTIALGKTSDYMKKCFTTVLKSVLALQNAKFLYGCTGINLDILARNPIWQLDLDYQCGTGHGVGYLLSVHEGPQGFRWRTSFGRKEDQILEEGMIITDEPGIYLENEFGIRIENELLCKKGVKNFYGQFMCFEPVTYCPIDLALIDTSLLNEQEIKQLNDYHQMVFDKLSPYLNTEELDWLNDNTKAI